MRDEIQDAVLIGGGIMSVTLATFLQELEPTWKMSLFEELGGVARESSDGWNNAGTGHTGFAELNYTPEVNGKVEIARAINIAEQFEVSRQFWAYLVQQKRLHNPESFINPTAHMSFVWGEENCRYLKARHEALRTQPLFQTMDFSTEHAQIAEWAPLLMKGRDASQKVAATHTPLGTDVNFGEITRQLSTALTRSENFSLNVNHRVIALKQDSNQIWTITVEHTQTHQRREIKSRFVFIGAGGASLLLLQKSGIPEAKMYGGFPVGGLFLSIENEAVANQHNAKVYGQAETGAPPMSVPHLDTRRLDGRRTILFGPFANFNPKFLKTGSKWDLIKSINRDNLIPTLKVGLSQFNLVSYLVKQSLATDRHRFAEIVKFFPEAKQSELRLIQAGQRVQIIKHTPQGASLQFGTEVVVNQERNLTALLGASPGASTTPSIMLNLLQKAFPEKVENEWKAMLEKMILSYGKTLNDDIELLNRAREYAQTWLNLPHIPAH